MGLLIRGILALAGVIAALVVVPGAANFGLVQAMIGMGLIAAVIAILALWQR